MRAIVNLCPVGMAGLIILILFISLDIQAQPTHESYCGTPPPSHEQVRILRHLIAENPSVKRSEEPYDLPLHIYLFYPGSGETPEGTENVIERFYQKLETTRQMMPEVLSNLYVCQIDTITEYAPDEIIIEDGEEIVISEEQDLVYGSLVIGAMHDYVQADPELVDDNAIPVYINYGIAGQGGAPSGIKLPEYTSASLLAHELGHYFGLIHTHDNTAGYIPDEGYCLALYPDHSCIESCVAMNILNIDFCLDEEDCAGLSIGQCKGDMIEDTPVDPGNGASDCTATEEECWIEIEGEEILYTPPIYNIMSYWTNTKIRFSEDQKERMIHVFENFSTYDFLRDENLPECFGNLPENILVSEYGTVEKIFWNNQVIESEPFHDFRLLVNDDPVTCLVNGFFPLDLPEGENVIGNGSIIIEQGIMDSEWNDDFDAATGLTIMDVYLIAFHAWEFYNLPHSYALVAADVDNDGKVTKYDAQMVAWVLSGENEAFESVPVWRLIPKLAYEDVAFLELFTANPFEAVWDWTGTLHDYNGVSDYMVPVKFNNELEEVLLHNTFSFEAVKSGDVNSSFQGLLPGGVVELSESPTYIYPSGGMNAGVELTVNVGVENIKSLSAFQLGLGYDDAHLELISTRQHRNLNENILPFFDFTEKNNLKYLWMGEKSQEGNNSEIIELKFKVKKGFHFLEDVIYLNPKAMDLEIVDGSNIAENPRMVFDVSIVDKDNPISVFPNPSLDGTIRLESEIFIKDGYGYEIYDTENNLVETGKFENTFQEELHVENAKSGLYRLIITNPKGLPVYTTSFLLLTP